MYAIKNKTTGQYAAKKSFYVFMPCTGKLTPILYSQKRYADDKLRILLHNRDYSAQRGFMNSSDELEVVEVALIERGEVKALPFDVPSDWEQLSLYP